MSKVAVIMGSNSDMPVMQDAIDILKEFKIDIEVDIVSAHRTPEKLFDYCWCRWCSTFTRYGSLFKSITNYWSASKK